MGNNSRAGFDRLIQLCGGRERAGAFVATFGRSLFTLWAPGHDAPRKPASALERPGIAHLRFRRAEVLEKFSHLLTDRKLASAGEPIVADALECIERHLEEVGRAWDKVLIEKDGPFVSFGNIVLKPRQFLASCGRNVREGVDLRYFLRRDIRERFKLSDSPRVARAFHEMAGRVSSHRQRPLQGDAAPPTRKVCLEYREGLRKLLQEAASDASKDWSDEPTKDWVANIVGAFIETSLLVGYLEAGGEPGKVVAQTSVFDAEFMLSNLFGLPTAVPGLDTLFGGGGLRLRDHLEQRNTEELGAREGSGRIVLVAGPRGSGKSQLNLQLAVEVARKGGCAAVFLLEQTPEDAEYVLSSASLGSRANFTLATTTESAAEALADTSRGALILLRGEPGSREGLFEFLTWSAHSIRGHRLSLLSVDPISSAYDEDTMLEPKLRERTHKSLQAIRESGANLVMCAENDRESSTRISFLENIADTVVHLSVDRFETYARRRIEITKSRYQREQRGEHTFSIRAGSGIHIYPSTASVAARLRGRSAPSGNTTVRFGHAELDERLSEGALRSGDVAVFHGPSGGYKIHLALPFLLRQDGEERGDLRSGSLLISSREDARALRRHVSGESYEAAKRCVVGPGEQASEVTKDESRVRVLALPDGLVDPGVVLQSIQDEFHRARAQGLRIDRVVVDGLAHWEYSSPMIRSDPVFGSTLVDLIRKERATTLLICGSEGSITQGLLQDGIIDRSDCRILFRPGHDAAGSVQLQVERTKNQQHDRRFMNIRMLPNGSIALTAVDDE